MGRTQDLLSSVKDFLSTDTAKGIGIGILGTGLGAAVGGSAGVSAAGAIGSAIEAARSKKKKEALEAEDRDFRKLQKVKAELDIDMQRANISGKHISNVRDAVGGIYSGAKSLFGLDGKNSSSSSKGPKEPNITPAPLTGPDSLSADDPEQLEKNINKIKSSGAQYGANMAQAANVGNTDKSTWKNQRPEVAAELRNKLSNPVQRNAAFRELNEQAMPGEYAKNKAIVDAGPQANITFGEKAALAQPGLTGGGLGGIAGGLFGSIFGPAGTAVGAAAGTAIGTYIGRGVYGQSDAAKDPDVAGTGLTISSMANYNSREMSNEAIKLINSIVNVAQPGDFETVRTQLPMQADFKALPVEDQGKVLTYLQQKLALPQKSGPIARYSSMNPMVTANL